MNEKQPGRAGYLYQILEIAFRYSHVHICRARTILEYSFSLDGPVPYDVLDSITEVGYGCK